MLRGCCACSGLGSRGLATSCTAKVRWARVPRRGRDGFISDLRASIGTDKTREADFAWPCRPPATTELVCRTRSQQLELQPPPELGWVPWQSGFFHRLPEPPRAPTPPLLDTRTHTPSPITEAHTLALGTKQASALESRRVGTRAMECGDTFRRLIGSRRQPLNSSFASAHHNPPRNPSPESAGKPCVPWALQPGSLEVRRCLPAPSSKGWEEQQGIRRDPGSPRGDKFQTRGGK